jgi:hypothetical protein
MSLSKKNSWWPYSRIRPSKKNCPWAAWFLKTGPTRLPEMSVTTNLRLTECQNSGDLSRKDAEAWNLAKLVRINAIAAENQKESPSARRYGMQSQKKPDILEGQVGANKKIPSDTAENRRAVWPTCILQHDGWQYLEKSKDYENWSLLSI